MFVSTFDGVFKTTDVTAGVPSWSELGGGLPGNNSDVIAGTPDGSTLYAQAGASIYRSDNGGLSWIERGGPVQRTVRDLASGGGRTFATSDIGLLRSLDGGLTWSVLPATAGQEVFAVAVAPSTPARVFARIGGDVRRSTDGGATFEAAVPTAPEGVVALAVDPANPDVAWAVGGFEEVFRSGDGGATWAPIAPALLPELLPRRGHRDRARSGRDVRRRSSSPARRLRAGLGRRRRVVGAAVDRPAGRLERRRRCRRRPGDPRHLVAAVDLNGMLYESANSGGTWSEVPGTDEDANPSALDVVQIDAVTFAPRRVDPDRHRLGLRRVGSRLPVCRRAARPSPPFDPAMDEVYNDAFEILADDQGVHVATQRSGVLDLVRAADVRAR